jgi:hypothetical protein
MFFEDEYEYKEISAKATSYKTILMNQFPGYDWYRINFSDLKVGDKVVIYFYSDSQRDMFTLYPKFGEVTKIEPKEEPMTDDYYSEKCIERITLKNSETEYNASHLWCSYLGNTRGYVYDIYRLECIVDHMVTEESNTNLNMDTDYDMTDPYESYDETWENESIS